MSIDSKYYGLNKLDNLVFKINQNVIGKKGVYYQKLIQDWQQIVGVYLANFTIPIKISTIKQKDLLQNILHLATNNAAIAIEISYQVGLIKEQVNTYFGYEYIQQIKLSQAVFSSAKLPEDYTRDASEDEIVQAQKLIESYDHEDDIKNILACFAQDIIMRR